MSADPKVIDALERAGIVYEVMYCDPALADTAAFCEAYGVDPGESANTILVASRKPPGHNAACVALATTKVDVNGVVRRRLGVKKVSFAPAELTVELTGMAIGGVTPPGLPEGLPIWVDEAVTQVESVVIGAGTRSAKIRLRGSDLARLPGVEVVPGLAVPIA
ncbi:MAG TPA: YbaK/EbsC family protein [Acidimicrobiia bacterium]|jgi:prolyl-tRNA editing enzyme YbaK/EbsC (Cys-tRNA(Pro) deacylase)